ncbi:MAG: 3D-(3,5/4)-trihydroxycyclohexane-1,2-dione acylhydrolase (decyclizing) [Anaerolineaceae bacterium]|nr:MAG: 3D-(3,5/4)-trihydroxycyclohexane-1,2-dione acylhydrolase (decyclizing) [Anaerolineaceae bacterium]
MGKIRMTVGQAIVKFLDNQFVSHDGKVEKFIDGIFTIFGHGIVCGLGQALDENSHGLKVYQGRNEQGMAHVAAGFAKQSNRRRIIPCASSIGPGAANMVTAVADATANNIPLLVFTGDTFATRQPDPVLQQIEQFHDASITTSDAFRPVSKYWDRVYRPEQLMSALLNAMDVLTDPEKTGGVCISLPQDVQGETYEFPDYFFKKRVHRILRTAPDELELNDAIELILSKKKPLVIVGGGARYSEAGEALLRFCEIFNIPLAETQSGKSVIGSSHPLNLGGVGVTGNSAANTIASQADLILGVGTRLTDFTTGSKELFRNPDVDFVLINVSRYHAKKLDAHPLIADAKVVILAITAKLEMTNYRSTYSTQIQEAKKDWEKEMEALTGNSYGEDYNSLIRSKEIGIEEEFIDATGGLITQTAAIGIIRKHIEEDAIIVGASGSLPGDLQRMWTTDTKDSYHMEYGYSCMGYEIAATLGAKLAEPNRSCYGMVGDGSFMMLHSEIATALQEDKKITVLLFDNCGFGCINNLQMSKGIGSLATMFRYRNSETNKQDGKLMTTDFAMIGKGYGMTTFTARTAEELIKALEEAKNIDNSVLIDIKVLPKSMTDGYGSWWHVGIGDSQTNERIKAAYEERIRHLDRARLY